MKFPVIIIVIIILIFAALVLYFNFFFLKDNSTLVSALTSMMSECHCATVAKKSRREKKNKGALRLPKTCDVHIQYVAFWNLYCGSELLLSV